MIKIIILCIACATFGFFAGIFASKTSEEKVILQELVVQVPMTPEKLTETINSIYEQNFSEESIEKELPLKLVNLGGVRFDFIDEETGIYSFWKRLPEDMQKVIMENPYNANAILEHGDIHYINTELGIAFSEEVIDIWENYVNPKSDKYMFAHKSEDNEDVEDNEDIEDVEKEKHNKIEKNKDGE